ncbi:dicarboxylic amino acid permease [Meredithblackwellia eburnea MCA 4105]
MTNTEARFKTTNSYEEKNDANVFEGSHSDIEKDQPSHDNHGDLHRGLDARQISMIALGGAIGTGLVIGSGTGLARAGPVGLLIAYVIMGSVCFSVMISLGEMATYLPHKKGFSGYLSRFADPALGIALGYNYWFKYLIVTPNNLVAASIVVQYWVSPTKMPVGAWLAIFIALIIVLNFLGVRVFGEVEFWMSLFKVITLTGLIIFGIVVDLGGAPNHDRKGFRYWRDQPFSHYLKTGSLGEFLGVWSAMTTALFAYMGSELVGVTFGEAKNPRKVVPATIKRTFWRLLIFYVGSIFVVGLIVRADDPSLIAANKKSTSAAASPFVVAAQAAGIRVLPQILNACILLFVLSAANSDLYIGSRTIYALAREGKAPAVFLWCNRLGVPYIALGVCSAFCCLAFLSVSSGSKVVFGYFTAMVTIFGAITWMGILFAHIRFMKALKVQGISRDTLPYKAPLQPYAAYTAFVITAIVCFFKGFDSFIPKFNHKTFITNYIGAPVFVIIYLGWKFYHKTSMIPLEEVDLTTGKREFDEDQAMHEEEEAMSNKPLWKKIWEGA